MLQKHRYACIMLLLVFFSCLSSLSPVFAGTNDDGYSAPRIVGGTPIDDPAKYPWITGLARSSISDLYYAHFCGGALIHPDWVITAAHCLENIAPTDVDVFLGTVFLDNPNSGYERIRASAFHIHPDYDPETLDNDIALIKLSIPSAKIVVQSLATQETDAAPGILATTMGWAGRFP